jgi:hypothetical protein
VCCPCRPAACSKKITSYPDMHACCVLCYTRYSIAHRGIGYESVLPRYESVLHRAAYVLNLLWVQIHFQDKEMAALRKENIEISSNVRQLLSRVPQTSRAGLDLHMSGGGSAASSPGKDLRMGPRSPSKTAAHTSNTREASPPQARSTIDGVERSSAAREAELIAGGNLTSSSSSSSSGGGGGGGEKSRGC